MDFMKKLNPFKRHHRQVQQQGVLPHPQQLQQLQISDSKRKAADKELQHLNQKIEKILANLDENEADVDFSREEECVVCLSAKATMKTYPCGHCVVCRLCFVKTIQSAVTDRRLPLKCVVCRTKILKLKQQRPRPSSHPRPSRAPSTTTAAAAPRGQQQQAPCPSISRSSGPSATPCRRPSTLAAPGGGSLKPTATKLMQPLLIYPAQRPGDPKRRPGIGWSSPPSASADGRTVVELGPTANTSLRLRSKNGGGPGGAGGAAAAAGGSGGVLVGGSGGCHGGSA